MGYCRDNRGRLCCDSCGTSGGVRRRPCRFTVTEINGAKIRYCPPPALCGPCFTKHGGSTGIHGDRCRDGAAHAQAQNDVRKAKLDAGDFEVSCASRWWPDGTDLPEGLTRVSFRNLAREEVEMLVPAEDYGGSAKAGRFLSDYPRAVPLQQTV